MDTHTLRVTGELLFESRACAACHEGVPVVASALGPNLNELLPLTRPGWVANWLLSSHDLRNDTRMPALFGDDESERQSVADVAEFLHGSTPAVKRAAVEFTKTQRDEGMQLWETLGCIACHRLNPTSGEDEYDRLSLSSAVRKFHDGELANWVRDPQRFHIGTRMPNFSLSEPESLSLEAWIRDQVRGEFAEQSFPAGDAIRGKELFVARGCVACHREPIGGITPASIVRNPRAKPIGKFNPRSGCLSPQPSALVPDFQFSDSERALIESFLPQGDQPVVLTPPAQRLDSRLTMLRCNACHTRDNEKSLLPIAIAEDGDIGKVPQGIPDLSATGEKLNSDWLRSFLKGHVTTKPRTWLETRMPAFPAWADELSTGFAHQHGLSDDGELSPYRPALADVGELLAQKSIGLDCRQCHGVGSQLPTGDKETLLAPGINFALAKQRLRYDYYSRFVLDPPRYAAGTRMPKLTLDGRTTSAKEIYKGDASAQFEALWNYIQRSRFDP